MLRKILSAAALYVAATSAQAQAAQISDAFQRTSPGENVSALFTTPIGGQTLNAYSGFVEVDVSGVGSIGPGTADAFYVFGYNDGGDYYDLSLGTVAAPLTAYNPSQTITRAIVFSDGLGAVSSPARPLFSANHAYRFVVDLASLGVISPTLLQFGITEGQYSDNSGQYDVTVYQLASGTGGSSVPEPASWALMIAGLGLTGTALRRPRQGAALPA